MDMEISRKIWGRRAFSLVEVIVIMSVTAIVTGAAVQVWYSALESAEFTKMQGDLKRLKEAVHLFKAENGIWPESLMEIRDTVSSSGGTARSFGGEVPIDPWGMPYSFSCVNQFGVPYSNINLIKVDEEYFKIVIKGGGHGNPEGEMVVWENQI